MSLQEPEKKMSKSDPNENGFITLLDPPDAFRRKIRRAVTDSDGEIRYSEEKPGVSNLLSIYAAIHHMEPEQAEKEFAGQGYGVLKDAVADAIVGELEPLQKRFYEIRADKQLINAIMQSGAEKAQKAANKTLWKAQKKIGFGPRKF